MDRISKRDPLPQVRSELHDRSCPELHNEVQRFVVLGPRNLRFEMLLELDTVLLWPTGPNQGPTIRIESIANSEGAPRGIGLGC